MIAQSIVNVSSGSATLMSPLLNCVALVFAGTGTSSYSGDNGAATSATLNGPIGVAVDASGRYYNYCPLHRYTVSSAMFDEIFFYFLLIFPYPI